jgi:hypothetical protein
LLGKLLWSLYAQEPPKCFKKRIRGRPYPVNAELSLLR